MNRNSLRRAALLMVAFALGCNSETPDKPRPTGTLKGKLTAAGRPLPAKTGIVFQHLETGRLYLAQTDETGEFVVSKPVSYMLAGRYDVSVRPPSATDEQTEEAAQAALDGPKDGKPPAPPVQLPKKYANGHESGLSFELQPGPNERPIDLKM